MVEGQHRVRLATAEVGLELNHRVPTTGSKPPYSADQHCLQALGQIGPAEEFHWIPVLVRPLFEMDLPEVGSELRLLVQATRNVLVRHDNLAPRLQIGGDRAFDGRACASTLLASHLLVQHQPPQLNLDLPHFVGLGRGDCSQQPFRGVQRPICVIARENFLMRPPIAVVLR